MTTRDALIQVVSAGRSRAQRQGAMERHLACWLLYDRHHLTMPQIAKLTGCSFAMVKRGIDKARAKCTYDPRWVSALKSLSEVA